MLSVAMPHPSQMRLLSHAEGGASCLAQKPPQRPGTVSDLGSGEQLYMLIAVAERTLVAFEQSVASPKSPPRESLPKSKEPCQIFRVAETWQNILSIS